MISFPLLTVLNVLFKRADRRAPRTDEPLTYFASPAGEKSGLEVSSPSGITLGKPPGAWIRSVASPALISS